VRITRHQLHWVAGKYGVHDWPFPFLTPGWAHNTDEERIEARRRVEKHLVDAELVTRDRRGGHDLHPLLAAAGEVLRDWTLCVDLAYRGDSNVVAACYRDDGQAVLVMGDDFGGGSDLQLDWADHRDLPVAVFNAAPQTPAAHIDPIRVPAQEGLFDRGAVLTRQTQYAVRDISQIVNGATGMGQVGVTTRPGPGEPAQRGRWLVTFVDSKGKRYRLGHVGRYGQRHAEFSSGDGLAHDIRCLISETRKP
jgi:EspG family